MKIFLNVVILSTIILFLIVFSFIFLGDEEEMLEIKENSLIKFIFIRFLINLFIICIGSILLYTINRYIFESKTDLNYYKNMFVVLNLISILILIYIYVF
jgi:hypothetical protein